MRKLFFIIVENILCAILAMHVVTRCETSNKFKAFLSADSREISHVFWDIFSYFNTGKNFDLHVLTNGQFSELTYHVHCNRINRSIPTS